MATFALGCGRIRGGFSTEGSSASGSGSDGSGAAIHGFQTLHSFYPFPYGASPQGDLTISKDGGTVWGMTAVGGSGGYGVIFKTDLEGNSTHKMHDFKGTDGAYPYGSLLASADNQTYFGMTSQGGVNGLGTIFKITDGGGFTTLHDFNSPDGAYPNGNLILSQDGSLLYGMTLDGGGSNAGIIFSMTIDGVDFKKIYEFDGVIGSAPVGSLVLSADGTILYGMTSAGGGANGVGIIFQISTQAPYAFQPLFQFDTVHGANPSGSLVLAHDGVTLFGMTPNGGANSLGGVFKFILTSRQITLLYSFDAVSGGNATGSLILSEDQKTLYGLSQTGGASNLGHIFKVSTVAGSFSILHDFTSAEGTLPEGSLVFSQDLTRVYGMTYSGGSGNVGSGFYQTVDGTLFSAFQIFRNEDGAYPRGSLIPSLDGKTLYGMTNDGGSNSYGVIFKMNASDYTTTFLHDFALSEGRYPRGDLVLSADGTTLYGMTSGGGANMLGTVFKISTAGVFTKLYDFDNTNGANPYGSLVLSLDGSVLYGMGGGANSSGTIFKMTTNGVMVWVYSLSPIEGTSLEGALVLSSDGTTLYGMASVGGIGNGTIFKITTDGAFTKMYDLQVSDGALPFGSLIFSKDGQSLFGMTQSGGNLGFGTLFKITTSGTFTALHAFDGTNGSSALGSLVLSKDGGTLYGLTQTGGTLNSGVIFSISTDGSSFSKLHDFSSADGSNPRGNLVLSNDGSTLYGMCSASGANNYGTIFGFGL